MKLEQLLPMQDKKSLESRLLELKRVLRALQKKMECSEKSTEEMPGGHLKITHKHGRPEFYHITERGSSRGRYISLAERELAAQLAQKDYDVKLMKVLPSAGEGMPFTEDSQKYYTANGERVRSKSEVIIADALLRNGVPYCYEVPLKLNRGGESGNVTFHPDFLCLNVRTRKEFYWEHFGKMGNEDYKENTVGKLNMYVENGFFPGRNLIFTMESGVESLDTRIVEKMIKEFLL